MDEFRLLQDQRDAIENPDFGSRGTVHDWRNYIPAALQFNWQKLSFEMRMLAYFMAEQEADKEQWGP